MRVFKATAVYIHNSIRYHPLGVLIERNPFPSSAVIFIASPTRRAVTGLLGTQP
jgi:hypothetical protein